MPSTRSHEFPKPSADVFGPREQVFSAQKGQKKCPIAKTKSSQKEGMEGNNTNTYLQPGPKSLSHSQQMSSHQLNPSQECTEHPYQAHRSKADTDQLAGVMDRRGSKPV